MGLFLTIAILFSTALLSAVVWQIGWHSSQQKRAHLRQRVTVFGGCTLALFIFIGCNLSGLPAPTPIPPPATLNPLFEVGETPEAQPEQTQIANTTEQQKQPPPTRTPIPTPVPTPAPLPPIVIYDEVLHPDWSLTESSVEYNQFYSDNAYSGTYSLMMSPKRPRQVLWFTLNDTAPEPYLRDDIIGITFRLYSGDGYVRMGDLAATAIGSQKYPYWVPNDETVIGLDPTWKPDDFSVTANYDYAFSPSRLYFLGLTSDVPPNTWVWVTDWFKNRTNDLDYKYVTGFYIRNDDGFRQSVLIDDLQIIRVPQGQ